MDIDVLDEDERKIIEAILEDNRITAIQIGEKLGYSEGTVRTKLTQIYNKFGITGDNRYKRQMLIEMFGGSPEQHPNPNIFKSLQKKVRCGVIIYFVPAIVLFASIWATTIYNYYFGARFIEFYFKSQDDYWSRASAIFWIAIQEPVIYIQIILLVIYLSITYVIFAYAYYKSKSKSD